MTRHDTRLVMKFGGTSMGNPDRIRETARIVAAEAATGKALTVVVSAMGGETTRLVGLVDVAGPAGQGLPTIDDEYDAVVSTGEQFTAGLLALMLRNLGLRARSWMGWQVPIVTDDAFGRARVKDIRCDGLAAAIDSGEIAVVPGFQGITEDGRITTLGRGGSDITAVAMAAALKCPCDIYTDVDGVYTTDPRLEPKARRLDRISHDEMLEMASLGAKVLHARSVELAKGQGVSVRVLSSFIRPDDEGRLPDQAGTVICNEDDIVEKRTVSAVALSRDEARITLLGLPDRAETLAEVFGRLADAGVAIDMIVQSPARAEGAVNLTFTSGRRDAQRVRGLMDEARDALGFEEIRIDEDVAKVSIVGVGMRSHADVARTLFGTLADKGVKVQAVSTSEIKISVLVDAAYGELAVRALHSAYGLEAV